MKPSPIEKMILTNQRLIMLALSNRSRNAGGMGADYHADLLRDRVKEMEREFDWIALPSERIS